MIKLETYIVGEIEAFYSKSVTNADGKNIVYRSVEVKNPDGNQYNRHLIYNVDSRTWDALNLDTDGQKFYGKKATLTCSQSQFKGRVSLTVTDIKLS